MLRTQLRIKVLIDNVLLKAFRDFTCFDGKGEKIRKQVNIELSVVEEMEDRGGIQDKRDVIEKGGTDEKQDLGDLIIKRWMSWHEGHGKTLMIESS